MKSPFTRKSTAVLVAIILVLLTVAAVVVVEMTKGPNITISVDDLAEMKTLAHEYLNERNCAVVSSDPMGNPNIADAPIIDPADMSPELVLRQMEDVRKLKARSRSFEPWDDFAVLISVYDIQEDGDKVVLEVDVNSYYHLIQSTFDAPYSSEGYDIFFTFTRKGNGDGWILTDVKLPEPVFEAPFT